MRRFLYLIISAVCFTAPICSNALDINNRDGYISNDSQYRMFTQMGMDNRVSINLNVGEVGHSVVVQEATLEVTTKINGSVSSRVIFMVMDPANGGSYHYISSKSVLSAYNIFYIIK